MKYQIDQSIKIEDTGKTTYISLVNGESITVSISAKDKRELKLFFRELGKPLIFKLFTFSVLCAKTLMMSKTGSVIIDCEYTGYERQIKLFITQVFIIEEINRPEISFNKVGKLSNAHKTVHAAMEKKMKGTIVGVSEVLRYYEKISKP